MPMPFTRRPDPAFWSSAQEAGPIWGATLRECHVLWLLYAVPKEVCAVLSGWLVAPTDVYRWQPPSTFSKRLAPFSPQELDGKTRGDYYHLAESELQAIRYTIDLPWQAISGITRAGLLVVHGIRLRQLASRLTPAGAARALQKIIAERPPDPRFAALYGPDH